MAVNVILRDIAAGKEVKMALNADDTVDEIIESVATYWQKQHGAYVLKFNSNLLNGRTTVKEAGISSKAVLEFMLDPQGG